MKTERDKYLTEKMGKCWHREDRAYCNLCSSFPKGKTIFKEGCFVFIPNHPDFSIWTGFGELKEWIEKHERWGEFYDWWEVKTISMQLSAEEEFRYFAHPDRFANAVYAFLKEAK